MKLFAFEQNGVSRLAVKKAEGISILEETAGPDAAPEIISRPDVLEHLASIPVDPGLEFDDLKLVAPIRAMEKIICIGTNYAEHAKEMGGTPPEIPVVFSKFASAVADPGQAIGLPTISQQVDFEAELVVVIGTGGRFIKQESALDHVFGYCCGNDISARDWQKGRPGGQWLLGKTFDQFAPIGPWIVTRDEIENPNRLGIGLRLNGETMQDSNTSNFIFPVESIIAHVSRFVTLQPGDLIFTGTPPGVGAGRNPPRFLQPGDQIEVEIEKIGILPNSMISD